MSLTIVPLAILLANKEEGSPGASERELLKDPGVSGVSGSVGVEAVGLAAEDVANEGFEENGKKIEPSTRFAFSRVASFLSSTRNLDSFFGSGVGGCGLRPYGTNPAGRREMCMEWDRRCLGRQGGAGSCGMLFFSAR